MQITLSEPNNTWLKTRINNDITDNTQFNITIGANTAEGSQDIKVDVDLIWFILLYIDDKTEAKAKVVEELLNNPTLLQKFKETVNSAPVKRVIAEYLLFNSQYLIMLKNYVDFSALNVPLDFISYALLIKRSEGLDTPAISLERISIVNIVLDTGFKVSSSKLDFNQLAVIPRVLLMDDVDVKFALAQRLEAAGYKLFGSDPINDAACAVRLIDARNNPAALALINSNRDQFKNIQIRIGGSNGEVGNLADYYYWVKEDLEAVHYLRDEVRIELTPSK